MWRTLRFRYIFSCFFVCAMRKVHTSPGIVLECYEEQFLDLSLQMRKFSGMIERIFFVPILRRFLFFNQKMNRRILIVTAWFAVLAITLSGLWIVGIVHNVRRYVQNPKVESWFWTYSQNYEFFSIIGTNCFHLWALPSYQSNKNGPKLKVFILL